MTLKPVNKITLRFVHTFVVPGSMFFSILELKKCYPTNIIAFQCKPASLFLSYLHQFSAVEYISAIWYKFSSNLVSNISIKAPKKYNIVVQYPILLFWCKFDAHLVGQHKDLIMGGQVPWCYKSVGSTFVEHNWCLVLTFNVSYILLFY